MSTDVRKPILYSQWSHALNLSVAYASNCQPGSLCYVIGSGGTGKSSLSRHLHATLFGDPSSWAIGKLPVIRVEADNADRGFFTPKALMRSLLIELRHPFFFSIRKNGDVESDDRNVKRLVAAFSAESVKGSMFGRMTESDMRIAFTEVARLVELKLIIVDEANLLALTQAGRVPTDYLEALRRLADQAGCGLLLLGTYDMLAVMDYSAQINRRSLYIHLDRMHCESSEDKAQFMLFLDGIEKDLGLPQGLLTSRATEVFEGTYGIPGEVVGLIDRARCYTYAAKDEAISWEHVSSAMQTRKQLRRMRTEADLIEAELKGDGKYKPRPVQGPRGRRARMNPRLRKAGNPK